MQREYTSSERIDMALRHREADRIALQDGPWGTTVQRWRKEGLPENANPFDYFHYEMAGWGADTSPQFVHETVEDNEEYWIARNGNGALVKNWKKKTSTPEMIDFVIKTPEDWEQYAHRFAMNAHRIDLSRVPDNHGWKKRGYWTFYSGALGYDKTQGIIGSENLLMAILQEPDWVAEMFMSSADLIIETASALIDGGFQFDGAFLYDDMGYRNGTLFSPAAYRKLLKPAHAKAFQFFHDYDMPVILHSCGCVKEFIPDLIDAGLDCLQPLEVKAGMDLIELKGKYGDKLAFMGGIDVRKMANPDPSVIEEEMETKILCAKEGGGYIYHSDHSVPDNVSFQQYCRVIDLALKFGAYD